MVGLWECEARNNPVINNLKKNKNKKGAVGITASKKYLKKGKKYSFRARTYTYFNNEKIYGKWSKTVSIKG